MADWTAAATLWTGVAAFVVSAATLGLVIRAEVRALRLGPAVFLRLEPFGTATANGDEVHVWELINGGGENASIVCLRLVGCEAVATAEYPVFKVVPAGDSRRLLVRSEDISCAWAVIGWTHIRDGRWATFQWFAPAPGAALAAERDEQTRRIRGR